MAGSNMLQPFNGVREARRFLLCHRLRISSNSTGWQDFILKRNGQFHTDGRINSAIIQRITSAANKHNKDLVRIHGSAHFTHIVIMDGASLAPTRKAIDKAIDDVAWSVRTFAAMPEHAIHRDGSRAKKRIACDKYFTRSFPQKTSAVPVPI